MLVNMHTHNRGYNLTATIFYITPHLTYYILEPRVSDLASLSSQLVLEISCLSLPGEGWHNKAAVFAWHFCGCRDLNCGPYSTGTCALPTESPQFCPSCF